MFWCWRCLDIYRGVSVAHPAPLSTVVHRSKVKVVTKATLIHCVLMKVQEVRTAEASDDIDDDLMPRYCTGGFILYWSFICIAHRALFCKVCFVLHSSPTNCPQTWQPNDDCFHLINGRVSGENIKSSRFTLSKLQSGFVFLRFSQILLFKNVYLTFSF